MFGVLLSSALAFGCAPESDDDTSTDPALQRLETGRASADGFQVIAVKANGTGCPAGTWHLVPDEDGKSSSLRFTGFETKVDRRKSVSVKDCMLSIAVRSSEGTQYALEEARVAGDAQLEQGTTARVLTKYYFQGDPAHAVTHEEEYAGPLRKAYASTIGGGEKIWSECGKERELNLQTTVRLKGSGGRKASTMSVARIEGLKLAVRRCGADADGGPEEDAGPEPVDGGPDPVVDGGPEGDGGPGPDVEPVDGGPTGEEPKGPGIVSVSLNGTGCPPGTAQATVTPDGRGATITFVNFEAMMAANQSNSVKNCMASLALRPIEGISYFVKSSRLRASAALAAGQSARVSHTVYVQGLPANGLSKSFDLAGPYDGEMTVLYEPESTVRTPCNVQRDLNFQTLVRTLNGTPAKEGGVTVVANATGTRDLYLEIGWERCP